MDTQNLNSEELCQKLDSLVEQQNVISKSIKFGVDILVSQGASPETIAKYNLFTACKMYTEAHGVSIKEAFQYLKQARYSQ